MASLSKRPRVMVVGAGLAGLSAARELQRSGLCDVTVLEATDRPGGRVQTVAGFASEVVELGANWIHGTEGNPIYQLAAKHGLLEEPEDSTNGDKEKASWIKAGDEQNNHLQMEDGRRVDPDTAKEAKAMYTAISDELDDMDMEGHDLKQDLDGYLRAEFAKELKRRGVGEDPERLRQFWLTFEHCCRVECLDLGCDKLRDVQLKTYCYYESLNGAYYTELGNKGYQGILDTLLGEIPASNVHLNAAAVKIHYNASDRINGDGDCGDDSSSRSDGNNFVKVECEDGRTFTGSHVIVTPSVGFLKEHVKTLFEPALPRNVEDTIETLQYGTVDKIFLKYKKRFWSLRDGDFGVQLLWDPPRPGETEEEEKDKFYRMIAGFDIEDKNDDEVLIGWIWGKGAEFMETLSDEEIGQRCTSIIRKFLGRPSIPEPEKVLCTRWHSNKYQRGAYGAFLPMHATGREYETMSTPIYRTRTEGGEKVPVLLFAGEAYHQEYFSTTHGAMLSGIQQAKVLIDFMTKHQQNK